MSGSAKRPFIQTRTSPWMVVLFHGFARAVIADFKGLSRPQRKHLRWFIFGILMSVSSSRLFQIAKVAPRGGHRTSCGNFLRSDWDSVSLMQARAIKTLRWMKPGKREAIYLLIDDTRKEKRGRQMEAVSKIYDHKSQKFIRGHMIVLSRDSYFVG